MEEGEGWESGVGKEGMKDLILSGHAWQGGRLEEGEGNGEGLGEWSRVS